MAVIWMWLERMLEKVESFLVGLVRGFSSADEADGGDDEYIHIWDE